MAPVAIKASNRKHQLRRGQRAMTDFKKRLICLCSAFLGSTVAFKQWLGSTSIASGGSLMFSSFSGFLRTEILVWSSLLERTHLNLCYLEFDQTNCVERGGCVSQIISQQSFVNHENGWLGAIQHEIFCDFQPAKPVCTGDKEGTRHSRVRACNIRTLVIAS